VILTSSLKASGLVLAKKFDKDEWLLNRHRKRSEKLLNTEKKESTSSGCQVPSDTNHQNDTTPKAAKLSSNSMSLGSRTIDSFGELLKRSSAIVKKAPSSTEEASKRVSRSVSSAADCGRPSKVSFSATSSTPSSVVMRQHPSGTASLKNSVTLRRKSMITGGVVAGGKEAADKWMEEPESIATETDIMLLERWIENIQEFRPDDPLHDLKKYQGYPNQQRPVFGKISDDHSATFDFKVYEGESDSCGRAHGEGKIVYRNGDKFTGTMESGKRQGRGLLTYGDQSKQRLGPNVVCVEGMYENNQLDGPGSITYTSGEVLYCMFTAGYIQGPAKLFHHSKEGLHQLKMVGWYSKGIRYGLVWNFTVGGGFLVGHTDLMGFMNGDDIAFLYPDLKTALVGTFVMNEMKVAQTAFLLSITLRKHDGLMYLNFNTPKGPFFTTDRGNEEIICQEPLLPDPYEHRSVEIRVSKIKGSGEGMFAKRSFRAGTHVSFYNGVRMSADSLDEESKEDWEANAYKIMDLLGPHPLTGQEGVIDIPEEYVSIRKYRASLAHKTNHSFNPNAVFSLFEHPRFGKVPAIKLTSDVSAGDEVTVSYDYSLDDAPPWYQELFTQRILDSYKQTKTGLPDCF